MATWHAPFAKALKVGAYMAAHLIVGLIIIAAIEIVRFVLVRLDDPKLFDQIPLRYIFDIMDLGILVVFVVLGTVQAVIVFRND